MEPWTWRPDLSVGHAQTLYQSTPNLLININCNYDCKLEKKFIENFFKIVLKDNNKKNYYIDGTYDLFKQCIDIRKFRKPLI